MNYRTGAVAIAATALLLTGCGDQPESVTPNARCAKSQKGVEVTNPDGKEYECKKTGRGKRATHRWLLDD